MIKVNVRDAVSLISAVQKTISNTELIMWMKEKADPYMRGTVFTGQFKTEGLRFGSGWEGILESSLAARNKGMGQKKYAKRKRGVGRLGGAMNIGGRIRGVNILQDTGDLFNKVTKKLGKISTHYPGVKITWGGEDYGLKYMVHQQGTLGKSKPNPPRPMIGASEMDKRYLLHSLYGYIGSRIRWYRR